MNCLDSIRNAILGVTPNVYHFTAKGAVAPYAVWGEAGGRSLWANDAPVIQVLRGSVDYFTLNENDPTMERIQEALSGVCSWQLESVQYEDATGYIHWTWVWEIA